MARFNEILAGRFNRGLQKLLSMKGEPPSPQLASEIMPTLPLPLGNEYRYIEGWDRFGAFANQGAGGVGTFSTFQLLNPAGSGILCVVEKLLFNTALNAESVSVQMDHGPTALGTVVVVQRLDRRTVKSSGALVRTATPGAAQANAVTVAGYNVVAAIPQYEVILTDDQELTVLPGSALIVFSGAANIALQVSVWWRERPLEDSEVS